VLGDEHGRNDRVLHAAAEGRPREARRDRSERNEKTEAESRAAHMPTMPPVRRTRKPFTSRSLRRWQHPRVRRALVLVLPAVVVAGCGGGHRAGPAPTSASTTVEKPAPVVRRDPPLTRLAPVPAGTLATAVQDAAAAPFAGGAVLVGGLTPADTSSDSIATVTRAGSRQVGRIPGALHDAAAVTLGRTTYVFGGGNGVAQLSTILAVDPRTGAAQPVGHLPAGSSDQAGAAVGRTAYVVGGYTGGRWLDTIVAWRPGRKAQVVAHLPHAVRYAAVAGAGGRLVIAGGSLESGSASDAVYAWTPGSAHVVRIGRLPAPTTHAAAAAIGSVAVVAGGRGDSVGTPTGRIVAVEGSHIRVVGTLPRPLSDLAAVSTKEGILLAGGRDATGTSAEITRLVPSTRTRTAAAVVVKNVYAADRAGNLSAVARLARPLVYVPNSDSNTVDVIDQRTFKVVEHFSVGVLPQHVVPAWDLKTLYVTNDEGNSLTTIDPRTGKPGRTIPVDDPYNMYFTPNGRYAIVVAERLHRLDFRDAHTFKLHHSLHVPCSGVDHMDFSADGSYAIVSCEFSGQMLKVDIAHERLDGVLPLRPGAAPQDVKLSPDGKVFYVADMNTNGVWLLDGDSLRVLRFMPTGRGAHGLYPSRDAKYLYVTNRGEGSISVVSFRTRHIVRTWHLPGGGSPDMGNVSADGKVLWLSGRYNGVLYAISTRNGRLLATIPVGAGPHGVCVWPQPGTYSLGHTGILR
jgi:YVTN family beta-propeller protein